MHRCAGGSHLIRTARSGGNARARCSAALVDRAWRDSRLRSISSSVLMPRAAFRDPSSSNSSIRTADPPRRVLSRETVPLFRCLSVDEFENLDLQENLDFLTTVGDAIRDRNYRGFFFFLSKEDSKQLTSKFQHCLGQNKR